MAGRGQGGRSESSALGKWNPTPPGARKHGPDSPKSPQWSAERRGILRQDAAAFRKGAELGAPFGAPPPRFVSEGTSGRQAYPAPLQTIRAAKRWLVENPIG